MVEFSTLKNVIFSFVRPLVAFRGHTSTALVPAFPAAKGGPKQSIENIGPKSHKVVPKAIPEHRSNGSWYRILYYALAVSLSIAAVKD